MGISRIAVVSFPGNNCEVESMRSIKESGMEALYFRWNDDRTKLEDIDGYFLPGGFAYEDRGRSGMVAARDPLLEFIGQEAEAGKVVIGNCNGAQVLVESGLIPLGNHLSMSLARNAINTPHGWQSPGYINEWVWIRPACERDRCATSDWDEGQEHCRTTSGEHRRTMHLPIAHGEGRFTTKDKDLLSELMKNDQIAFQYCDASGTVSEDPFVTPNGAVMAIAGICNPAGNVVALMPHPERTPNGGPYFASMRKWIEKTQRMQKTQKTQRNPKPWNLGRRSPRSLEIFIDTIIVNNEERTVEQAARRISPELRLKQWKYVSLSGMEPSAFLSDLAVFNPNKERAYIRRAGKLHHWQAEEKREETLSRDRERELFSGISLLRRDEPDTGASGLPSGSETGVCYTVSGIRDADMANAPFLEVFANPHASSLEILS